jgi:hypothetical protein
MSAAYRKWQATNKCANAYLETEILNKTFKLQREDLRECKAMNDIEADFNRDCSTLEQSVPL